MTGSNEAWLIGIILDVSYSMQKNWKTRNGKIARRFEVVRDVLNEQIWKISTTSSLKRKSVKVFCLGMGFQKKVNLVRVAFDNGKESLSGEDKETSHQTDLVCDLLALSEIIPTKSELESVQDTLNKKWNRYAEKILIEANAKINEDVYQQLQDYLQSQLYQSAYARLHASFKYRLYTRLQDSSWARRWKFTQKLLDRLTVHVEGWQKKIETSCTRESEAYFHRIKTRAEELFEQNQKAYEETIGEMLQDFASNQIKIILELLTAGHEVERVLSSFDESRAFAIADQVYKHIDREVREKIQKPVMLDFGKFLYRIRKELRASLDRRELEQLTQRCVQKYGWEILEPFVQETVFHLIKNTFKDKAEKMLLYWVTLSASREVIRLVSQIRGILPEASSENIISSDYMFGSTPISEALTLASIRLLDSAYTDHKKILVVVSDGEFELDNFEQSLSTPINTLTDLLKQAGVIVISLYVTNRNLVSKLVSRFSSRWPAGAKIMFEMASTVKQTDELARWAERHDAELHDHKLFLQINHSKNLEEIFEGILGYEFD